MQVEFNEPEIPTIPFKGWYTVVICKTATKFKYHHVDSLLQVHEIIKNCDDYMYHRQNLSLDPYKYIVITNTFYNDVEIHSLLDELIRNISS